MTIRKFALGGAAAVALAGLLGAAPAYAHTSQPATPEEIQQTDALNAQALANARMGTTANQPAAATTPNVATPAGNMTAPEGATPDNDSVTPSTTAPPTPPTGSNVAAPPVEPPAGSTSPTP